MLKLYNTLTRKVEEFHPLNPPEVRMYVCGPTVYDFAHIGNFRTFLFSDLLRRYLKYSGYRVRHVMNITDVDDKIIQRSVEQKVTLRGYTDDYLAAFFADFDALGAERPEEVLRATDHIAEMVALIQELRQRGHTYEADGSIYFRIATFPTYGQLSKVNLEGNVAGASERVDADEYTKEDARDFVLWKAAKPGEPSWEASIGAGRPGWHLECSAMSMRYLGESFDLHTGGIDLIFPHHEDEIAQSEAATGRRFVGTWLHCAHLHVSGDKMSKSLGNIARVSDLLAQGVEPRALRLALISAHYRTSLNYTPDSLPPHLRRSNDSMPSMSHSVSVPGAARTLPERRAPRPSNLPQAPVPASPLR